MKQPLLQDDAFLADVAANSGRGARVWWLGQSGLLVHFEGEFLLIDPYLSDSLTRKYHGTSKPHVRMTTRVVDPARLDFIGVVTSSHNHTDHLDAETLNPLRAANPNLRMVLPEANRAFAAERLAVDAGWFTGLDDGQSVNIGPWRIHAIASAHERIDTDEQGRHVYLGYVVQFGPHTIYHPGDCVPYDGLAARLRTFDIGFALLPVNGSLPERGVAGNFWGREAAALARDAGIRRAAPCHYDMFEFNTVTPDEFVESCAKLGQRYDLLQNGEGLTL
jgi:L-ascorbate metabolism protein UlaG (beta-lactamase superfamily)